MFPSLEMLVRVLNHDDGGIDHRTDRDGYSTQRHDVGIDALDAHHDEGREHAQRQGDDGDKCRTRVPEEQRAYERHDDKLFDELRGEVLYRRIDELRAIVGRDDLDAFGKACLQVVEFLFDGLYCASRIRTLAQDDDAAGNLAFAIELGDASAQFGADLDRRYVAQRDRNAAAHRAQRDRPEIVEVAEIARGTHHIFGFAHLDDRAARFLVGGLDCAHDLGVSHAERCHPVRFQHDLVLLDHSADAGDLGNAGNRLELVAQEPVLQAAQSGKVVPAGPVDERIFVDPPHTGCIGPKRARDAIGQAVLHLVEIFEHARACPVEVGTVLEDDIDIAVTEHRIATDGFRPRHREHGRCQGIGDLFLDDPGGLTRIV